MRPQKTLQFADAIMYGENRLLFANWEYNGVYSFDMITEEVTMICQMPFAAGREFDQYQVKNIIQKDNTIFFFMYEGICVFDFDKETAQMSTYSEIEEESICKMSLAIENHDNVWCIPENMVGKLYSFDLNKKCFERHINWEKQITKYDDNKEYMLSSTPFIKDGEIWTCIIGTSKILRYHLEKEEMSVFEIPEIHISNLYESNDILWITLDNQIGLFRYEIKTGSSEIFLYENRNMDERPFSKILEFEEYIILLPEFYDKILFFHKEKKYFIQIEEDSKRLGSLFLNNKMYLFPWGNNKLRVIDLNNLQIDQLVQINPPREYYEYLLKDKLRKPGVAEESEISLAEFVSGVVCSKENVKNGEEEAGSKIFKEIKRMVGI